MDTRPKVVIVYDMDGWAFDNISKQLVRYLSDEFDVTRASYNEFAGKIPAEQREYFVGADVVLFMSYHLIEPFEHRVLPDAAKLIVCVYDHITWRTSKLALDRLRVALSNADMSLFAHERLYADVLSEFRLPHRTGFCEDGVDPGLFPALPYPDGWEQQPLTIGWTGNGEEEYFGDTKGLQTIKSVVASVPGTQLVLADRQQGLIPHHQMTDWYRQIHLYVCWSSNEGTPNPILEAACSGRAWLATYVGVCPLLVERCGGTMPPGWILRRDPAVLRSAIETLRDNRALLPAIGAAGAAAVRDRWDWRIKADQFRTAIKEVLRG